MRRTLIVFTLLAALVVPAAHAETGPPSTGSEPAAGEAKQRGGEQRRQGTRCRPGSVLVAGAFVQATEDGFTMLVRRANRKGHSFVGKTVDVTVLRRTQLRGLGDMLLSEVPARTRVVADLRVCKAGGTTEGEPTRPALVAAKAAFHLGHPEGRRPEREQAEGERPARPEQRSERA